MHPILGSVRRLAFYLLAWVLIGVLLSAGLGYGLAGDWLTAVLFFVPLGVVYALVTQSAWYVCRIFPLVRSRAWHVASAQIMAALPTYGVTDEKQLRRRIEDEFPEIWIARATQIFSISSRRVM